jgi:predicted RNase H-like nuclease (RuvC/YqgF family)
MSVLRQKVDRSELQRCYEQIQRLTAENQDLRRASECFGALAERLNRELLAERNRALTSDPCGSN